MTTGASLDITHPDYLWASVVCEMKGISNLQGWIFMEPDQIGILLVISVHAISVLSVRHKTGGTGDSHSAFCPSSFFFPVYFLEIQPNQYLCFSLMLSHENASMCPVLNVKKIT